MEISLTILVAIACGSGLLAAIVMVVCFACCHCFIKRQVKRRRGLKHMENRMVYEVESPKVMKMDTYQPLTEEPASTKATKHITSTLAEGGKKDSHYIFDEKAVAEKAIAEDKQLLWTNKGQVLQATDHTVSLFTLTNTHPTDIKEIHMKGSPCYTCSTKLVQHFKQCHEKPTLYVSTITHTKSLSDREGLRQLIQDGFKVKVWIYLNQQMGKDGTNKYLEDLKSETNMYSYFGIYN